MMARVSYCRELIYTVASGLDPAMKNYMWWPTAAWQDSSQHTSEAGLITAKLHRLLKHQNGNTHLKSSTTDQPLGCKEEHHSCRTGQNLRPTAVVSQLHLHLRKATSQVILPKSPVDVWMARQCRNIQSVPATTVYDEVETHVMEDI